jgi:predicted porin
MGRVSSGAGVPAVIARTSNVVQYTTPTFVGFNATLSYSPNFQEAVQNNLTSDTDGQIFGVTVRGAFGPFYGQVDYAKVDGNTQIAPGAGNGSQIEYDLWKAGVGWKYMPGANLSFIWAYNQNNNTLGIHALPGVGNQVDQSGYTVNWEHTFGNIQVMAQYGWLDDINGCNGTEIISCGSTGAQAWMVGARYLLSKRTWLYASYNQVKNDDNQFVDYNGAAQTSRNAAASITPYGADPQIWALGIFHAF